MSEQLQARSPLKAISMREFAARTNGKPGLIIEERQNIAQLQLLARNNDPDQLSATINKFLDRDSSLAPMEGAVNNGLFICATGPQEYWIMGRKREAIDALGEIQVMVEEAASVFDQSEGRLVVHLAGERATDVLAKGTGLDLRGKVLPTMGATHTVVEHIGMLVAWQSDPRHYDICVPRSYASSFLAYLCEAAQEYGYAIKDHASRSDVDHSL